MADNTGINQERDCNNVIPDDEFSRLLANKLHQIGPRQKYFLKSMIRIYVQSVKNKKDQQIINTISNNGNEDETSVSSNTRSLENLNNVMEDNVGSVSRNTNNELHSENISMEAGPSMMDTSRISPTPMNKILDEETSSTTSENDSSDVYDSKESSDNKGSESSSESETKLLNLMKKMKKTIKRMKKKKKEKKRKDKKREKKKKRKEKEREKKKKELQKRVKYSRKKTSGKHINNEKKKYKMTKGRIIRKCFTNQTNQDESEDSEDS